MDILEKLLNDFIKLPKSEEVLPTYLEISGQPHFENVCSNILAFYFDTTESHKLKDLVLRSFIETFDSLILEEYDLETINIQRELYINENKRIDIVIEFNNMVITIENKIYHILNNDLELYEKSIREKYPNKEKYIFLVLSLKDEKIEKSSFININYNTFFEKLKQNIGFYFVKSNNQYTTFLIDFIKTIENLTKMETINKEYFNFFLQNKTVIDNLIKENDKLKKNLFNKVSTIFHLLPECLSPIIFKKWIYLKYVIVFDFNINDDIVALDIVFELNNVKALLFTRKSKSGIDKDFILSQLEIIKENQNLKNNKNANGRIIVFEENINFNEIDADDFVSKIEKIISKIKI
jgi:hypothetical protein